MACCPTTAMRPRRTSTYGVCDGGGPRRGPPKDAEIDFGVQWLASALRLRCPNRWERGDATIKCFPDPGGASSADPKRRQASALQEIVALSQPGPAHGARRRP